MSTLNVTNISDGTNTTSTTDVVKGSAKAWVVFQGTGTVAIYEQYNVTSVNDNGTGLYTINFTNALEDSNYCFVMGVGDNTTTQSDGRTVNYAGGAKTTSAFQIRVEIASTGADNDQDYVCVTIFR